MEVSDLRGDVLTEKQRRFCEEYVMTYNAKASYLKAFNCSEQTANTEPYALLKKPTVQAYIKQLQEELVSRWGDVASILVQELVTDVITKDAQGKHTSSW